MTTDKEVAEERPGAVDLDRILSEEVGQLGRYQLRSLALAALIAVFTAFAASEYVFTTSRIPTRCLIPECDEDVPVFDAPWVEHAVPPTAGGSGLDNCQRYLNSTSEVEGPAAFCPPSWFNTDLTEDCRQYVYENTHSVVYDYGLACDEWRRSLIGSIRTLGTLTALPITGYVSDRWGRRTALAINAFNTAWMGVVRYWADTYIGFLISEFAEATFGSGLFSCAYILVTELVGPKYRVVTGAMMNSFFSVGQVFLGLIAWGVPNWRLLTLTLYTPQLITILYFWIIAESVRWLMSKGRYEEAEETLKTVARVNRTQLSEKSLEALRLNTEEEKRLQASEREEKAGEPWLIVLVLRSRPVLIRCLVSPVWWVTTTFVYYGLSINSVNMSGNRYLNFVAVSAVEIPGYWTAVFLLSRIGRKPVLIGAYWLCALCQLAYIFLPDNLYWLSLLMYLIGKFCIAMVMTSVYVYTAELYPTKYRHSLFAYSSMIGRIGSIVAPLTPALAETVWSELPFVLFGGFAFVSGCLVFLTPETLGSRLPDTMAEAEQLGRRGRRV